MRRERSPSASPVTMPLFESVSLEPGRVVARAAAPLRERYLSGDFWASYPAEIDLTAMPRFIALLPALYALAPVAWAAGGRYTVAGLSQATAEALSALRDELRRSYPGIAWSGEVLAVDTVADPDPMPAGADAALLFSTGVDSTCSALRHAAERLALISVGLDDDTPPSRWDADIAEARRFARESGHAHLELRTNARSFVQRTIWRLHPSIRPWWPMVGHGMAFIGIAGPVAHASGCRCLYIAATHSQGFEREWGSSPRLDPLVAIGRTTVVHDGYELSRFARVQTIVDTLERGGRTFALRVCHTRDTPEGLRNCGVCEKCVRTQASLVVAGADPRRYGFHGYDRSVLEAARRALESDDWKIDKGLAIYWQELGDAAAARLADVPHAEEHAFLDWLAAYTPRVNHGPGPGVGSLRERPRRGAFHRIRRRLASPSPGS